MKLIIDTDLKRYQPQFYLSKILDIENVNIDKFKKVYLLVDDLSAFRLYKNMFNGNKVTFLYDRNISFKDDNLEIEVKDSIKDEVPFIKKLVKQGFVQEYFKI